MPNQQRKNWRWPNEGKGTTIGATVGIIMNHWGVSPCCTNPPVAKAEHRNDTNTPKGTTEPNNHPQASPILRDNHCGPDDRDCHTHTHTQHRRTIVPKTVATPLAPAVHQGPTSRRCGHARRRPAPTPRGDAQTTHRARATVLCTLRRPTCPQSNAIGRNQAGCSHSNANTLGPAHHLARTHQTDDKSKERKRRGGGAHQQRVLC